MTRPRVMALFAAAIVIALAAALAGRASAPARQQRGTALAPEGRDKRGAQLAATRVVLLLGDPATLLGSRRGDLRAVTAPGASATINARLTMPPAIEQATGLLEDLQSGRPVVAYVVPVASQVTRHSPEAATVDVWTVSVLGTRRMGVTSSSWSTETVSLAWYAGWKVTDVRTRPGPTPAPDPEGATPVLKVLHDTAGMRRYDDAGR